MAERTATKKSAPKSAAQNSGKGTKVFTDEERSAITARAREVAVTRRSDRPGGADGESTLLASIAAMQKPDRDMAERLHTIIKSSVPALSSTTWYGMPAYAIDGKTICFFQPAQKFKTRYATLGFSDKAKLDEGSMWPNAYALTRLTAADEARIRTLVKKAVG